MEKNENTAVSGSIELFLDFIRATEQELNIAVAEEKWANDATQDILHAIEFRIYGSYTPSQLIKKIKVTRQKRRDAKETIEVMTPVCEWVGQNRPAIKSLERLLGDVRKVERRQASRSYYPRTDILDAGKRKEKPT